MPQGSVRQRLVRLAVGLAALALTELARTYYRPFVRTRGLSDFHLADTLGNSLGTVTTVLILLAVFGAANLRTTASSLHAVDQGAALLHTAEMCETPLQLILRM